MLDVLDSVLDTVSVFAINALLPTRISLPIPAPPVTINDPEVVDKALVLELILIEPIFSVAGAPAIVAIVNVDPIPENLTVSMFKELDPKYKSAKGFSNVPKLSVLVVGTIFPPTFISPPT